MSHKIGRNEPCPCGSGKKYKRCHLLSNDAPQPRPTSLITGMSIKERNAVLINAIWDIFGFSKGKSWDDVRKEMSDDQVRELYRVVGSLWPTDTNIIPLLPKPDSKLRGFYMGETKPDLLAILQNIVRYSLYTDEILIVNPLMNPRNLASEYNPIHHPELFKQDTLEMVFFIFKMLPWIQSGMVNMIPSPVEFDYELRKSVWGLAEKRWKDQKLELSEETLAEIEPRGKRQLEKTMFRLPPDKLEISIKNALPNLTQQQVEEQIKYVYKSRKQDPLILDQDLPEQGELSIWRNGANLELGLYIGQLTGSYLYTDKKEQWTEILSSAQDSGTEGNVWSPLTHSFQSLDFNFLNNIDSKFAYELKIQGRLEKFRSFLRRVWVDVEGSPSAELANKHARMFSEELREEYGKAKEEWSQIDKKLVKWITGSGGVSAIISGGMDWRIPAVGFCVAAVGKLLEARTDRKNFKQNVPMGVFLDLEKNKKNLK